MSRDTGFFDLIGRLYDIPARASAWPDFLEGYAAHVGADMAAIQCHRRSHSTPDLLAVVGLAPALHSSCAEYCALLAIPHPDGPLLHSEETVIFGEDACRDTAAGRSAFCDAFLVPLRGGYTATTIIDRTPARPNARSRSLRCAVPAGVCGTRSTSSR